jgi:hypothetical protein
MKRLAFLAFLVVPLMGCSLNPQPFPPDNPDAAGTGIDSGKGNGDASNFGDSGGVEDAGSDSAPVPQSDGGGDADASDASEDASDAGDAQTDATAVDATND